MPFQFVRMCFQRRISALDELLKTIVSRSYGAGNACKGGGKDKVVYEEIN